MIRQPIITVLGHVDHGKTSILDAIRSSRVAKKEAGAITQHIGATEIPIDSINEIAGDLIQKFGFNLKIPGLLVIDTPGHEAFSNLRKRGGSIADLAILVVDATQGIQPQTKEAIEILKANKVPFIIAMNKIDLLPFYDSKKGSFLANLNSQNENIKRQMDEAIYVMVGKIYEEGFPSERFDRCEFGKQIPIVPCSAHTLEGLPEILTLLSGLSQKYLENKLEIKQGEVAKGAILEAKEEQGLGKTVDIILYKGTLNVNDEIAFLSKNGVIKTKIRALLEPKPLVEMKDTKEKFKSVKNVTAASGVKIAAPNLNDAIAGSTLTQVRSEEDLIELEEEIKESTFETDQVGLTVKADAIGSLEAVVALLKNEGYQIKKAEIGNVNRKDIMGASGILEKDPYLGSVISFNVDIDNDAEKEAKNRDVKIFSDKVIYKIIEDYDKWVKEKKEEAKKAGLLALVYPSEFEVMRGKVFRNNKPAIFGANVKCGKLKEGTRIINKDGEIIGKVSGIQNDGKSVKELNTSEEAAVAIDDANFGKNIFEGENLYTYLPPKQYPELIKFIEEFSDEEKELIKKIREKIKIEEKE